MRFHIPVLMLQLALITTPIFPAVLAETSDSAPALAAAAATTTATSPIARRTAAATKPAPPAPHSQWVPVLSPLPEGTQDLAFSQVMVTPVGPAGLELAPKAHQLLGKPVRMVGHMVRQMQPIPWTFLLSPVPQSLHERDYFLCDDLPANTVRVYLPKGPQPIVPYRPGLVAVTGILTNEGPEESDGRSSVARLLVRPGDTNGLVFVTAFTPREATDAPAANPGTATQFSAQNRREHTTDNTTK